METTTLYRKYRPQTFDDVVGQDHIVSPLASAIANKTFGHAYLFAGSRGLGKTSIARIFARDIGTSDTDIHEIDAASHRRIDDIRELRDAVHTLPFSSEYKVYIIDEVHMLTTESFNALLKTLEEPPAHALFILATTEADRLPDTIVSRCETYTFKKPNHQTLHGVVTDIAEKEGYTLEDSAASLIALLGEGSFRDAEGVLQKVLSGVAVPKGKKNVSVSVEDVERITNAPRGALVNAFVSACAHRDSEAGFEALETAVAEDMDMRTFAQLVLQRVRFVLLLRFAPKERERISELMSEDDLAVLVGLAEDTEVKVNSQLLDAFLEAFENMRYAYIPQLPLERALVKLIEG